MPLSTIHRSSSKAPAVSFRFLLHTSFAHHWAVNQVEGKARGLLENMFDSDARLAHQLKLPPASTYAGSGPPACPPLPHPRPSLFGSDAPLAHHRRGWHCSLAAPPTPCCLASRPPPPSHPPSPAPYQAPSQGLGWQGAELAWAPWGVGQGLGHRGPAWVACDDGRCRVRRLMWGGEGRLGG